MKERSIEINTVKAYREEVNQLIEPSKIILSVFYKSNEER